MFRFVGHAFFHPVVDTRGREKAGRRAGRHFRWGGTLAKHMYIFMHKNIGALVEVHAMVK